MKKEFLPHPYVEAEGSGEACLQQITFPVVGIGSSEGWLEALAIFLKNIPSQCGKAGEKYRIE